VNDVRRDIDNLRAAMSKKGKKRPNKGDNPDISFAQQRYVVYAYLPRTLLCRCVILWR
jgi:hypothetical protein